MKEFHINNEEVHRILKLVDVKFQKQFEFNIFSFAEKIANFVKTILLKF